MIYGDLRRLIVRMPPRHGKSEIVSRRLPPFLFGRNPDWQIFFIANGADLAADFNADVQEIMESPAYLKIFPNVRLPQRNTRTVANRKKRNSDVFQIEGQYRGIYRSVGVGGSITGKGGDWIIMDDLIKNREEADSETIRENTWRFYSSTARTRLGPDGRSILCMTPWHSDDISYRIIEKARASKTEHLLRVIDLPDIAPYPPAPYDWRQPGQALWPERFPVEALEQIRAEMDDYDYFPLYRLNPLAAGGVEWPAEFFKDSIYFDEWPAQGILIKVLSLDPSKGQSDKAGDFSALVSLLWTVDGTVWIDADLDRLPAAQLANWVFCRYIEFNPDAAAIETNQFQIFVANDLRKLALANKVAVNITPIQNTINKQIRIRTLGPLLKSGKLRIRNTKGGRLLLEQLRQFPKGSYDDGPDALEMAVRTAKNILLGNHGKVKLARGGT